MTEINYSMIGQGSRHEVYMLHGVKGGVIAIVDKGRNGYINHLVLGIRCQDGSIDGIRKEFVDNNSLIDDYYELHETWGWRAHKSTDYPELHKFKGLFLSRFGMHPEYAERFCIEQIEKQFKILKKIYDRNTRH